MQGQNELDQMEKFMKTQELHSTKRNQWNSTINWLAKKRNSKGRSLIE